jgi:hypothetical protein
MKQLTMSKIFFIGAMLLLVLSVVTAVVSLYSVTTEETETHILINDSFRLTPQETRRHGLGSFRGSENLALTITRHFSSLTRILQTKLTSRCPFRSQKFFFHFRGSPLPPKSCSFLA